MKIQRDNDDVSQRIEPIQTDLHLFLRCGLAPRAGTGRPVENGPIGWIGPDGRACGSGSQSGRISQVSSPQLAMTMFWLVLPLEEPIVSILAPPQNLWPSFRPISRFDDFRIVA